MTKKILSIVLALATVFTMFAVSAYAASAPLKISIKNCKENYGALCAVKVTVSVKNTSSKAVKNVVVSSKSNQLVTISPNLGKASASKLKAGGSLVYSYVVLLRRSAALETSVLLQSAMFTQHFLARPDYLSPTAKVSSGSKVSKTKSFNMTATKANLTVTAYSGLNNKDFANAKKIVSTIGPKTVAAQSVNQLKGKSASTGKYYTSSHSYTPSHTTYTSSRTGSSYSSSSSASSQRVYITETGTKYHYNSKCGNGDYYSVPLEEAVALGLKPCEKCVK